VPVGQAEEIAYGGGPHRLCAELRVPHTWGYRWWCAGNAVMCREEGRVPARNASVRAGQRKLREQMRGLGMSRAEIAAEMARRYKLRPRAAWRAAWGWTLEEAAERYNALRARGTSEAVTSLTGSRLSEWENWPFGTRKPPITGLCLLAEIYHAGVLDLIDFHDREKLAAAELLALGKTAAAPPAGQPSHYQQPATQTPAGPANPDGLTSRTAITPASLPLPAASGPMLPAEEEVGTTLRRDFFSLSGSAIAGQLSGMLENELDNIHMTLDRGTVSEARISYFAGTADDLGIQVVKLPPLNLLQPALKSIHSIRSLLEQRQPTRHQIRLVQASAKLCTVVGEIMFNIGQFENARQWYMTAEHAAHDVGDRFLADIALAGHAYLPTYSDDPRGVLALLEPRLGGNPPPSPAIAWLWGFKARAHAVLKEMSSFGYAIEKARENLERSPADLVAPGIFSFLPEKLAFYEAVGAVWLSDTSRAMSAADCALSLYDPSETTEPTLVRLQRASALVQSGEVPEACQVAKTALLDRQTYHGVTVRTYARKFNDLIGDRKSPEISEWRAVRTEIHGKRALSSAGDDHEAR